MVSPPTSAFDTTGVCLAGKKYDPVLGLTISDECGLPNMGLESGGEDNLFQK